MFSFFRINDPYRLVIIFFILIIISLPFFIGGRPLTIPELSWMLVGEKLSEGGTLYVDVWSNISPLAASVFWLIDEVFGRSQVVYQILGLFLVIAQSAIFNNTFLHFKAYNENNYVPAFIYALLMTSHFDFFTLSPTLMAVTVLLHVIHLLIGFIQQRVKNDEMLLKIGVYLGISVLFFFPMFLYIIVVILSLLFFTGVSVRRILLLVYGFLLPLLIVGIYYYFQDGTREFLLQYIYSYFIFSGKYLLGIGSLIFISAVPIVFLALAIFKVFSQPGFTNFQVRLQQIMFLMLIVGIFVFLLANNKAPYQLAVFVPPSAFFISHYFLLIRRKLWTEALFSVFLLSIIVTNWFSYYSLEFSAQIINNDKMIVQDSPLSTLVEGKKILVLGDEISLYKNAQLATPYLDWKLARSHFEALDYYDNITSIYQNLMATPPEIIVDREEIMPDLFVRIPVLKNTYTRTNYEGVYRRIGKAEI